MNKKEWRFPNKNELMRMYENLHKKRIGGFSDDYYWSSSDHGSENAWGQDFKTGYECNFDKNCLCFGVRAVRVFVETEKYEIGQETGEGFIFDVQGNIISECKKQDEPRLMKWGEHMELIK